MSTCIYNTKPVVFAKYFYCFQRTYTIDICVTMLFKFEEVFAHIDAYRALSGLGYDILLEGSPHMKCPVCGGKLNLIKHNVMCENPSCSFLCGNYVDLIVNIKKYSYQAVLDYLFNNYYDHLNGISAYDPRYVTQVMAAQMSDDRLLFSKLLLLRENNKNGFNRLSKISTYYRKNEIDKNSSFNTIFGANKNETIEIIRTIKQEEHYSDFLLENNAFVIIPYFRSYSKVGFLDIVGLPSNKKKRIPVSPATVNYYGLLNATRLNSEIRIYPEVNDPITLQRYHHTHTGIHVAAVSPIFEKSMETPVKFHSASLIWKHSDSIEKASKLSPLIKEFTVIGHEKSNISNMKFSWHDFLYKKIKTAIEKSDGKMSPELLDIIDKVTIPKVVLDSITKWLADTNFQSISALFKTDALSTRVVPMPSGNVVCTSYGYQYQKPTGETVPFTNFIIDFEECLAFHGDNELFYRGRLVTSGNTYPIVISRKSFAKPSLIELEAQKAFKKAVYSTTDPLPVISNSAYARYLPHVLTICAASVPSSFGISCLGYDEKAQCFRTPLWQCGIQGIEDNSMEFHPSIETFKCFSSKQFSKIKVTSYASSHADAFIAIIVSLITRSFLGVETRPFKVKNTVSARNVTKSVFRALGQTKIFELSPNMRVRSELTELSGLHHYPLLVSCPNTEKMDSIFYPCVAIVPEGYIVIDDLSEEQYRGITLYADDLIKKAVQFILHTEHSLLEKLLNSTYSEFSLIEEGSKIVRLATSNMNWGTTDSRFPIFKDTLSKLGIANVTKIAKLDLTRQVITMKVSKNPVMTMYHSLIAKELKDAGIYCSISKRSSFTVLNIDIATVHEVVHEVFGKEIKFSLVADYASDKNFEFDYNEIKTRKRKTSFEKTNKSKKKKIS